jgi:transcriptional regulator with XRE-family HTH domain
VRDQTRTVGGKRTGPGDRLIGAKVRMRRHLRGLSQSELGRAAGVTFQQIQKYENGTNRIGAARLQRIAEVLDIPPGWFFEDAADASRPKKGPFAREPLTAFLADRHAAPLVQNWLRLPPRVRRAVANLVRRAAGEPDL